MEENIGTAIIKIMENVGYVQKQKGNKLNYTYAGESALIAAIRPQMVINNVFLTVDNIDNITRETYETRSGSTMNDVIITGSMRFTHAPSKTSIVVWSSGEGSDVGDKAIGKAMTGMYKYALRQTFCIETGDDPDKEPSETMERKRKVHTPTKSNNQVIPDGTLVNEAISEGGKVKSSMALETAEKMVDSKGRRYGDMTNDELSGYSIGIGKLLAKNGLTPEKHDEYTMKQDAIGVILASRNA